jgi:caffeoyl-CoA O-methyltransferase
MSDKSTALSVEHFAYIARHTRQEDALLRELKSAATAAGIPAIWISPEQASFLQILLRAARAREVVEVGTLAGYSAIWLARALPPDGRLRTIEIEPRHADFATDWIARSDVKDRVEVLRGDARQVLAGIPARSVDACFIDADKEGYPTYLDECVRIARRGGLILVDNAFAFGELLDAPDKDAVRGIRAFNDAMAARGDLQSIIVPFGDGCWVGVVL